jgi:pyridoxamine 5'-phosphate oxidase
MLKAPTKNPIRLFEQWFEEARSKGIPSPEAMTLATASRRGVPSARIVLLKAVSPKGFVFYTNYESRKGSDLESNPRAALVFHWEPLGKQVRIEGRVEHASRAESNRYFASRDRGSRIGAWASNQSQPIPDRATLLKRVHDAEAKYPGDVVPRPPHWGGYRVIPERIEFWSSGEFRLHDRFVFTRSTKTPSPWKVIRLSP